MFKYFFIYIALAVNSAFAATTIYQAKATVTQSGFTHISAYGSTSDEARLKTAPLTCPSFIESLETSSYSYSYTGTYSLGGNNYVICEAVRTNLASGASVTTTFAYSTYPFLGTYYVCPDGSESINGQCGPPPDPCQQTQGLPTGHKSVQVQFDNVNVTSSSLASFIGQTVTTAVPINGNNCAASGKVTDCGLFPAPTGGGSTLICSLESPTYGGTTYAGEQSLLGAPKVDPNAIPIEDMHGVCPDGQYGGNVNGTPVCVKPNGSANTVQSTTTNPDGTTTTTSTTTSCVDGKCTESTTTSGTDAQGTPTGSSTSTTEAHKGEFCEKNPNDPQCKVGTANVDCSKYLCDGDAVQCAILKKQWEDSCKLLTPDIDPSSIFNKAADGTDGFSVDEMKANAQIIYVGDFDTTGSGWSRSCPADVNINVPVIGSFVISFQRYCGILNGFATVLLSITLLACLTWVIKD